MSESEQMEKDGRIGQGTDAIAAEIETPQQRQIAYGHRNVRQLIIAQVQLLQDVLLGAKAVGADAAQPTTPH